MIRFILIFLFLFTTTTNALAAVAVDHKLMRQWTKELRLLYKNGLKIHTSYDLNSTPDVRACHEKYGHLRKSAATLRDKALALNNMEYRSQFYPAVYAAFACVYCGGDGKECFDILPPVEKIEGYLKRDGY